jgi:hypothetical protein
MGYILRRLVDPSRVNDLDDESGTRNNVDFETFPCRVQARINPMLSIFSSTRIVPVLYQALVQEVNLPLILGHLHEFMNVKWTERSKFSGGSDAMNQCYLCTKVFELCIQYVTSFEDLCGRSGHAFDEERDNWQSLLVGSKHCLDALLGQM